MYDQLNGLTSTDLSKKKEQTEHYTSKLEFGYKIILVLTTVGILYNIFFYTFGSTMYENKDNSTMAGIVAVIAITVYIINSAYGLGWIFVFSVVVMCVTFIKTRKLLREMPPCITGQCNVDVRCKICLKIEANFKSFAWKFDLFYVSLIILSFTEYISISFLTIFL